MRGRIASTTGLTWTLDKLMRVFGPHGFVPADGLETAAVLFPDSTSVLIRIAGDTLHVTASEGKPLPSVLRWAKERLAEAYPLDAIHLPCPNGPPTCGAATSRSSDRGLEDGFDNARADSVTDSAEIAKDDPVDDGGDNPFDDLVDASTLPPPEREDGNAWRQTDQLTEEISRRVRNIVVAADDYAVRSDRDGLVLDKTYVVELAALLQDESGWKIFQAKLDDAIKALPIADRKRIKADAKTLLPALKTAWRARRKKMRRPVADMLASTTAAGDIGPGYEDNIEALVRRFNRRHAVGHIGSTVVVAIEDRETGELTFLKVRAFHDLYANVRVSPSDPDAPGSAPGSVAWIEHPMRRTFTRMVYQPRKRTPPDVLNQWRGFGVPLDGFDGYELPADMTTMPRPRGSWRLWRKHVWKHICGGNPNVFKYMIRRLAQSIQRPDEVGRTILVMTGVEGAGKGIYGQVPLKLFGHHGLHLTQRRQLVGNFNAHLANKSYLYADETAFAGSHEDSNRLKALATEDVLLVERKGIDVEEQRNTLHIDMATNEDWAVMASATSRRPLVLKVSDARRTDLPHFDAIRAELSRDADSGYRALLWDMLTMKLAGFDVRRLPETSELANQRVLSFGSIEKWFHDVLWRGYVFESDHSLGPWLHRWQVERQDHAEPDEESEDERQSETFVASKLLHRSYIAHCRKHRARDTPKTEKQVVEWLCNMAGFAAARKRRAVVGEEFDRRTGKVALLVESGKSRGVVLPGLTAARDAFQAVTGLGALEEMWAEPDDVGESEPRQAKKSKEATADPAPGGKSPF